MSENRNLPEKKQGRKDIAVSDDFLNQAIENLSPEERREISGQVLKREIEIAQDARQRQAKSIDAMNDTNNFIGNMSDLSLKDSNLKVIKGTNISETGTGTQKITVAQGSGGCLSVIVLFVVACSVLFLI